MAEKVVLIGISGASSSGKTSVSQLIQKVLKNSVLVHEDDYYKTDSEIPMDEVAGEQNWDCPDSIDFDTFIAELDELKAGNVHERYSHQPKYDTKVSAAVMATIQSKCDTFFAEMEAKGQKFRFVLVDGFMIYHEGSRMLDTLDVKLFLRASYALLKKRRESRAGYQTLESFWVDPPGYFDKLVYPNYKKYHSHLFENNDIENGDFKNGSTGIDVLTIRDDSVTFDDMLQWSIDKILQKVSQMSE